MTRADIFAVAVTERLELLSRGVKDVELDAIWTANSRVRNVMQPHQVKYIYYSILGSYVLWSFVCAFLFSNAPKLMTDFIANFNNLAIGVTSFQLLWINHCLLPREVRPKWYHSAGVASCGAFYLGLAALVFAFKIWPMITGSH